MWVPVAGPADRLTQLHPATRGPPWSPLTFRLDWGAQGQGAGGQKGSAFTRRPTPQQQPQGPAAARTHSAHCCSVRPRTGSSSVGKQRRKPVLSCWLHNPNLSSE
ncbi:hypothetical protein NDU88_009506 [Pleurodeles waltl]|uniref:Uncharacterized protein n=1 Tax=Pleurodeles waltl TaxID=8319 RepID=A0AAV7RWS5_PLEWA|nr:hypothetical protein NDU88_009506 [Pleurodeles waltl]